MPKRCCVYLEKPNSMLIYCFLLGVILAVQTLMLGFSEWSKHCRCKAAVTIIENWVCKPSSHMHKKSQSKFFY